MAFSKVGINYINDKLLKCVLQEDGQYLVELKNGMRIPVSKADYDALVDGLLCVNGVHYADASLIASAKAKDGGYIVAFSNGNQFPIEKTDYDALVEAGFYGIGGTYYNPTQVDKVYSVGGGYFAEMKNGVKCVMTEEEYDAIVESEGPVGELIEFEQGDEFNGFDFGDSAINGRKSPRIEKWMKGLTYEEDQNSAGLYVCKLMMTSTIPSLSACKTSITGKDTYWLICVVDESQAVIPYASSAFEIGQLSASKGWQNLEDGKVKGSSYRMSATSINNDGNWNGVLIGKYVAEEPSGGMTEFDVDRTVYGIEIDPDATYNDNTIVGDYLDNILASENGEAVVVFDNGDGSISAGSMSGFKYIEISPTLTKIPVGGEGTGTAAMYYMTQATARGYIGDDTLTAGVYYSFDGDTWTKITEKETWYFKESSNPPTYGQKTVTAAPDDNILSFLNGTLFGAVLTEAE